MGLSGHLGPGLAGSSSRTLGCCRTLASCGLLWRVAEIWLGRSAHSKPSMLGLGLCWRQEWSVQTQLEAGCAFGAGMAENCIPAPHEP